MLDALRRPASAHLRSFLTVPVRPQTYRNLLYLGLAFPLGLLYFVFVVVGVSVGVSLSIVLVGLPILLLVLVGALGIAGFERWLTALLLDVEFDSQTSTATDGADPESDADADARAPVDPASAHESDAPETPLQQVRAVVADPGTWKALVYLPTKFAIGIVALVLATTVVSTAVTMLFAPLYYQQPGVYVGVVTDRPVELHPTLHLGWNHLLVTLDTVVTVGFWRITRLSEALLVAVVGGVLVLVCLHVLNGLARLSGWWARWMLADSYDVVHAARSRLEG